MPRPLPEPFRMPALLAGALLCAFGANLAAPAHRRLPWRGWVPPPTLGTPPLPAPSLPAASLTALAPPAVAAVAAVPAPAAVRRVQSPSSRPGTPSPDVPSARSVPAVPGGKAAFRAVPDQPIREISSQEAWSAFQGRVPFLDARRSGIFAAGHIPGAHSAPLWESTLEARLIAFEATLNPAPGDPIVLYCDGGGCEDSHLLARRLVNLGYRNLLIYRDGFPDWTAQGRPQARGDRP